MNTFRFFLAAVMAVVMGMSPALTLAGCAPTNNYNLASGAGPVIDVKAHGAKGDGATDDTAAVQAAIAVAASAKGTVLFSPGTYVVSNLTLATGVSLRGPGSTLRFKTGSTGYMLTGASKTDITVSDITLDGGDTTTYLVGTAAGNRSGINIGTCQRINIAGCYIKGFTNHGIHIDNTGSNAGYGQTVKITNCELTNNWTSLHFGQLGEYCQVVGTTVTLSRYGTHVEAGNTYFSGCMLNNNVDGVWLSVNTNDSHGSFVGCSINHNSQYALLADQVQNGMSFEGCHFYDGDIYLKLCTGITITGGHLYSNVIYCQGGGWNRISDNFINGTITVQHDFNSAADKTDISGNHMPSGEPGGSRVWTSSLWPVTQQLGFNGFAAVLRWPLGGGAQWGLATDPSDGRLRLLRSTASDASASAVADAVWNTDGRLGLSLPGATYPTAKLEIGSGTSAAGTAPLKIGLGTLLSTPEAGALEATSSNLYFTNSGPLRRTIMNLEGTQTVSGPITFSAATTTFNAAAPTISLVEAGVRNWGLRSGGTATNRFDIADLTAGLSRFAIDQNGSINMGKTSIGASGAVTPAAYLELAAGTATATTGPLKLNSGALNTVPVTGVVEFLSNVMYVTLNGIRERFLTGFTGTSTVDPTSIAAGTQWESGDITVTGVVAGDVIAVGPPAAIEAGLSWNAVATAANTIHLRITNNTGSPVDPISASWKFVAAH